MGAGYLLVRAVLNPARCEAAMRLLLRLGVEEVSLQEAVGIDGGAAPAECGGEYLERSILEFSVPDSMAEEVLRALVAAARTGRKDNDGKVFILKPLGYSAPQRQQHHAGNNR